MENLPHILYIANLVSTLLMVGIIWLVQIVNYPLFSRIESNSFADYHKRHVILVTFVVALPMLVEAFTSVLLLWFPPHGIPIQLIWLGVVLIFVIWLTTLFFQIPQHSALSKNFSLQAYHKIVRSNWLRTFGWSARGLIVIVMLMFLLSSSRGAVRYHTKIVPIKEVRMEQTHPDIQAFFNNLNKDTMHLVDDFYDQDVQFADPLGEIQGRGNLKNYYAQMYKNVIEIEFPISTHVAQGNDHFITWQMITKIKGLNGGKQIILDGTSHIRFGGSEGKAVYHRDYFDMGEMVYQYVPILGGMVRFVNKRMEHKEPK